MNTEQNDLLFDPNEVNEALKSADHMDDLFKEGKDQCWTSRA